MIECEWHNVFSLIAYIVLGRDSCDNSTVIQFHGWQASHGSLYRSAAMHFSLSDMKYWVKSVRNRKIDPEMSKSATPNLEVSLSFSTSHRVGTQPSSARQALSSCTASPGIWHVTRPQFLKVQKDYPKTFKNMFFIQAMIMLRFQSYQQTPYSVWLILR